jgi:UTP--glucose-1-phosphate uridylyltransferase
MEAKLTKAVIPAAGWGTRFLPATKAIPKEMLPLVDKPSIQWVVEEAVRAGITDVCLVTSRNKSAIEDHFDRTVELERILEAKGKDELLAAVQSVTALAHVTAVRQGEALGLGHAVGSACRFTGDEAFVVLLPDDVMHPGSDLLSRMIAVHDEFGGAVMALMEVAASDISSYGAAAVAPLRDGVVEIHGMVEKPAPDQAPSNLAVVGRYVLPADVMDEIASVRPGVGGEIQLTDAIARLAGEGRVRGVVLDPDRDIRYDVGLKQDYLRAVVELGVEHPELGVDFLQFLRDFVKLVDDA